MYIDPTGAIEQGFMFLLYSSSVASPNPGVFSETCPDLCWPRGSPLCFVLRGVAFHLHVQKRSAIEVC